MAWYPEFEPQQKINVIGYSKMNDIAVNFSVSIISSLTISDNFVREESIWTWDNNIIARPRFVKGGSKVNIYSVSTIPHCYHAKSLSPIWNDAWIMIFQTSS